MWYTLAARNFPTEAERAVAIKDRDTVAKLMSPEQVQRAQLIARDWKPKPQ